MKIVLPENISEITLEQAMKLDEITNSSLTDAEKDRHIVSMFTKIPLDVIGQIDIKDYKDIINQVVKALNTDCEFTQRFILNDIEFGFIPNLNKITANEYADIDTYKDDVSQLNKLMAILFRPVIEKDKNDNYNVSEYNGTEEYKDVMLQMPMNIVNGGLGFFLSLSKELQAYILKYTEEAQRKAETHQTTLRSGGGMLRWFR